MSDETAGLFDGLDGPRELRPELRDRLEAMLLGSATQAGATTAELPLGDELTARLRDELTDPVAGLLAGIDGPRPLPPALRARLAGELGGVPAAPTRRWQRGRWLAAAAVIVVLTGIAVSATRNSPEHGQQATARGGSAPLATPGSVAGAARRPNDTVQGVPMVPAPAPTPGELNAQEFTKSSGSGSAAATVLDESAQDGPVYVSPGAGPIGGGTSVQLRGHGLGTAVRVTFGSRSASFRVVSDQLIQAVTPPASDAGPVSVSVLLSSGIQYTLASGFTYRG